MWCAAVPNAPPEDNFDAAYRHYLDILWSGRRDSNPRPSPWQLKETQLPYLRLCK